MCRVILATRGAIEEYDKRHGLLKLLDHLEKQCGGQGNGVTLEMESGNMFTLKGVNVTIEKCAELMLDNANSYKRAVFHTRIASVAEVSDERCHPFYIKKSGHVGPNYTMMNSNNMKGVRGVACMNGTMYSGIKNIADVLGITDTEVVLKTLACEEAGDFIDGLMATDQVWVGVIDGKEFAIKGDGALVRYMLDGDGYFFCSSLPVDVEVSKRKGALNEGFCWYDGEVYDEGTVVKTYSYGKWASTYDYKTNSYVYQPHTKTASEALGIKEYEDYDSYYEDKYVKDSNDPDIPGWYGEKLKSPDLGSDLEPIVPSWVLDEDAWLDGWNKGKQAVLDDIETLDDFSKYPTVEEQMNTCFEDGWELGYQEAARLARKGGKK